MPPITQTILMNKPVGKPDIPFDTKTGSLIMKRRFETVAARRAYGNSNAIAKMHLSKAMSRLVEQGIYLPMAEDMVHGEMVASSMIDELQDKDYDVANLSITPMGDSVANVKEVDDGEDLRANKPSYNNDRKILRAMKKRIQSDVKDPRSYYNEAFDVGREQASAREDMAKILAAYKSVNGGAPSASGGGASGGTASGGSSGGVPMTSGGPLVPGPPKFAQPMPDHGDSTDRSDTSYSSGSSYLGSVTDRSSTSSSSSGIGGGYQSISSGESSAPYRFQAFEAGPKYSQALNGVVPELDPSSAGYVEMGAEIPGTTVVVPGSEEPIKIISYDQFMKNARDIHNMELIKAQEEINARRREQMTSEDFLYDMNHSTSMATHQNGRSIDDRTIASQRSVVGNNINLTGNKFYNEQHRATLVVDKKYPTGKAPVAEPSSASVIPDNGSRVASNTAPLTTIITPDAVTNVQMSHKDDGSVFTYKSLGNLSRESMSSTSSSSSNSSKFSLYRTKKK